LEVDGIRFDFDDSWQVEKWDDSSWYRRGIQLLQGELTEDVQGELRRRSEGTKAVDLLGLREDVPYLIEVKDFRGFSIENKQRQLRELPLEIGLKARDTIAGVAGLVSLGNPPELPERWLRAVRDDNRSIHVMAWVAEDLARPGELAHKRAAREQERLSTLKQRLAWFTRRVWVSDSLISSMDWGVTATSLQGAGPARRSSAQRATRQRGRSR
jgi:hypothetical protein